MARKKASRVALGLAIKQTGARFAGKRGKTTLFKLGGGFFTAKELARARVRVIPRTKGFKKFREKAIKSLGL